jgi:hypothetical protein
MPSKSTFVAETETRFRFRCETVCLWSIVQKNDPARKGMGKNAWQEHKQADLPAGKKNDYNITTFNFFDMHAGHLLFPCHTILT